MGRAHGQDNPDWGYDLIVGAMANLGYRLSDQTVGNILQRHGIPPAPERKRTTVKAIKRVDGSIGCKERMGGLPKYYHQVAA